MDNSVVVSLRDIVVEFDGQRILDGLNLDIHDKEFVTLLGPSGCGKTTTLRLIAGFLEPNAGQVLLKGQDITGVPPYKRPVNTVFQKYALFPHLNVFENVAFGLREHTDLSEEEIQTIVARKLEQVGLPGIQSTMPGELSGGMKKRVGLARAIAFDPRIIFYDEPSSGLDPITTVKIDELMKETQKKQKATSVVVTHDMVSACNIADRIAMIYEGELIAIDTVQNFCHIKDERVQSFMQRMYMGREQAE